MTAVVVDPHVISSGLSLGFNDTLTVSSGGQIEASFFQDTQITIQNGGAGINDFLTDLAVETVDGVEQFATVANGAVIFVNSDGSAGETEVIAGGTLVVGGDLHDNPSSGIALDTTVQSGLMEVYASGQSVDTTLSAGGQLTVYSGIAITTLVDSGGTETLTVNATPTLGTLAPTAWTINQPGYTGAIAISARGALTARLEAIKGPIGEP